jgi:endonuclease/exonuclease/phosphatase (EEP) superfamily protein YafD
MKSMMFFAVISLSLQSYSDVKTHDPAYGECSFACKEIPIATEVMRKFGTSTANQLRSNKLKILSWNLYKGRKDEFTQTFAYLASDKDVVMLSEATTADPVSTAMENVPGFGWDFATCFLMKKQVGTGTAVGSYAASINPGFYRTTDIEPFVKSPKTIATAKYAIPNSTKTLLVLSIHGINWSGNDALERQLRMTVEDLKKHDGPIVFAGDFNIKNSVRLQITKDVLAEAGLTRVNWTNPEEGSQLDDAFTRGVNVTRAELINNYIDTGSDHPAIELDVEVQ